MGEGGDGGGGCGGRREGVWESGVDALQPGGQSDSVAPLKASKPLMDTSSPPEPNTPHNICSQTAALTPNAAPRRPIPPAGGGGGGQMAASWTNREERPRPAGMAPRQATCHSALTALWWLPMFTPVKRQIVGQAAAVMNSPCGPFPQKEEVKEKPWP